MNIISSKYIVYKMPRSFNANLLECEKMQTSNIDCGKVQMNNSDNPFVVKNDEGKVVFFVDNKKI